MRIALVVHGFPPLERSGVENHCAAVAAALATRGHRVEVLAPRVDAGAAPASMRREERDGYGLTWLSFPRCGDEPEAEFDRWGAVGAFRDFVDRHRPDVLHFQHCAKLGWSLVEEAALLRIPTLFTAHDYSMLASIPTLVRPDLSPLPLPVSVEELARCDYARSFLNARERLGDYQWGVVLEQLEPDEQARLEQILYGDLGGDSSFEAVLELRTQLEERRGAVVSSLRHIFAPGHCMREALVESGIRPERVVLLPYGIDTESLQSVPAPRAHKGQLRFGFLGSLSKHKGAHVLLEAFAQLGGACRVELFGDSSDRPYVEAIRRRAGELGAGWHGGYESAQLPEVLQAVDVVVVPSLWRENSPFVVREAFAARRPVLASACAGLADSVREGVDGLLFRPGDAGALAQLMRRLCDDRAELVRLGEGTRAPGSLEDHVDQLEEGYSQALLRGGAGASSAAGAASPAEMPGHLRVFAERVERWAKTPRDELVVAALDGLERMRRTLALDAAGEWPGAALGEFLERQRDATRVREEQIDWLCADRDRALEAGSSLRAEMEWQAQTLRALEKEVAWQRTSREEEARSRRELEAQLEGLRQALADRDREIEWRRSNARASEDERARLRDDLAELVAERDWLRGLRASLEKELDWLRELRSQLQQELDWLRGEEQARATDRTLAERLRGELQELDAWTDRVRAQRAWTVEDGGQDGEAGPELGRVRRRIGELAAELEWRRCEMGLARDDGGALFKRLLQRSGLGRRLRYWSQREGSVVDPGGRDG